MYHMNGCSITTRDPRRLAMWELIFGTDRIPVKTAKPRFRLEQLRPVEVYAYDLDAARLHLQARRRFAVHIASRARIPYQEALHQVDGWPIQAVGCEVVENNEPEETAVSDMAVFAFMHNVRARTPIAIA